MKINEVLVKNQISEGPLDFAKQAWAGAKGAVQGAQAGQGVLGKIGGTVAGAKAGAQRQGAANVQKDLINKVATKAIQNWGQQSQNIQTSTQQTPTANDAKQWFTTFSGQEPTSSPAGVNDAQMQQWITKEVGAYLQSRQATAGTPGTGPSAGSNFVRGFKKGYTGKDPGPGATTPRTGATMQQQPSVADNQPTAATNQTVDDNLDWNPKTNMLSINGVQYLKTKQGWQDYNTKELIAAKDAAELNTAFDQATGRAPVQTPSTQTQQPATAQQSAGTTLPAPTTATNGDLFAGDTQQPEAPLPDVSQLTAAERAELRKQLQA